MREKGADDYICESSLSHIFMSKLFLISPSDVLNSGTQQTPLEAYLNYSFSRKG